MAAQRPIVLCLGDSITNGLYSGNWVGSLAQAMPQFRFVNCGVNALMSGQLLEQLPDILSKKPQGPLAAVTLLVGTNDVMAENMPRLWEKVYQPACNLEDPPSTYDSIVFIETILSRLEAWAHQQGTYSGDLTTHVNPDPHATNKIHPDIAKKMAAAAGGAAAGEDGVEFPRVIKPGMEERMREEALREREEEVRRQLEGGGGGQGADPRPKLQVLLMTLPPLGEVIDKPNINYHVDAFNEGLHGMLRQYPQWVCTQAAQVDSCLSVSLLDLNGRCKDVIRDAWGLPPPPERGAAGASKRPPAAAAPPAAEPAAPTAHGSGSGAADGNAPAPAVSPLRPRGFTQPKGGPVDDPQGILREFTWCWFRRVVTRCSLDTQSRNRGTVVLAPDRIHLNDRGARLVVELLRPELAKLLPPGA